MAIVDRDTHAARSVAEQYGWGRWGDSWQDIVDDPSIDIVDNAGPNDTHYELCVAAAKAGKALLCEKPLERDGPRALKLFEEVRRAGVSNLCAFMYRSIPAIQHAKSLIVSGALGDIHHFRARFLLSFASDPGVEMSWRFERARAGAGALGDLGSHHIDLARFLVGEVGEVAAITRTFVEERPGGEVSNDDAFVVSGALANGATLSLEGSRVAGNHSLTSVVEVDGSRGSLRFDFERLNEISVSLKPERGFRTYLVTRLDDPFADFWFPVGIQGQHPISWADCFAHQAHALAASVASGTALPAWAPTFRDGYRVAETVDTIERAASAGTLQQVRFGDE